MKIPSNGYVPVLKWRMGEYQALLRLDQSVKNKTYPLLVVPPIEYDFEEKKLKKNLDEHLKPFAKRLSQKWGNRRVMIDFHDTIKKGEMDNGDSCVKYIFDSLQTYQIEFASPVVSIKDDRVYLDVIKKLVSVYRSGISLRLNLSDLIDASIQEDIDKLVGFFHCNYQDVDLILDLGVPANFDPIDDFASAIYGYLASLKNLKQYRSFVLVSSSLKLSEVRKPGATLKRKEWDLYLNVRSKLAANELTPSFGDYTIDNPEFLNEDMRKLKPAGKIVYTTKENFEVVKGGSFRDDPSQMHALCRNIISKKYYDGAGFSRGDKHIADCANEVVNNGNLTTWKWVCVNHHITKIVSVITSHPVQ